MSKDKIEVSMNVYDIPILIEELEKAQDTIKKLQQEKQQLESNRDKAIEYVEHHKFNKFGDIDCNEAEDIIDILKGDSDE